MSVERLAAQVSGGQDFNTASAEMLTFMEGFMRILTRYRTIEEMKSHLKTMDEPSVGTMMLMEGCFRYGPKLVESWISRTAKKFIQTQGESAGRPTSIPEDEYAAVCNEVAAWERKGRSPGEAKKLVAKRKNVSSKTIDRIWAKRADYPANVAPMRDVENFVSEMFDGQGKEFFK